MEHTSLNIGTININTITNSTKLNALRTFIRTVDLDIVFLQEVENDQLALPGFNVVCNVDHARRGTAIALKEHIRFSTSKKAWTEDWLPYECTIQHCVTCMPRMDLFSAPSGNVSTTTLSLIICVIVPITSSLVVILIV